MSALKIWERRKQLQFIEKKEKEFLRERVWAFWLWCGRFGHGVGVLVRFRKRGRQWERVKKTVTVYIYYLFFKKGGNQ